MDGWMSRSTGGWLRGFGGVGVDAWGVGGCGVGGYGCVWVCLGVYGCVWVCMGVYGLVWVGAWARLPTWMKVGSLMPCVFVIWIATLITSFGFLKLGTPIDPMNLASYLMRHADGHSSSSALTNRGLAGFLASGPTNQPTSTARVKTAPPPRRRRDVP